MQAGIRVPNRLTFLLLLNLNDYFTYWYFTYDTKIFTGEKKSFILQKTPL